MDETKIRDVAAGRAQMACLSPLERVVAHERIDREIERRAASASFGVMARAAGATTVAIDDEGSVVQTSPDGTIRVVNRGS